MHISSYKSNPSGNMYKVEQGYNYAGEDYWYWWVWIEGSAADLDKIDNVVYNLHYTFPDPVKTITTRENKFRMATAGWGTFTIYIRLNFKDKSVIEMKHNLQLQYPDGEEPSE